MLPKLCRVKYVCRSGYFFRPPQKNNAALSVKEIESLCAPEADAENLLRAAMNKLQWSARAYHRVLKLARTIADLAHTEQISSAHIAEAIQYRRALSTLS
jgi:magnesium chelatase family protein